MRRLFLPAICALAVALALSVSASFPTSRAAAEGVTSLCVFIPNANNNCPNAWVPKLLSSLSSPVTSIKSISGTQTTAPGQLGIVHCFNPNVGVAFIQFLDAAQTSLVTLGTTTPIASFAITTQNTFSLSTGGPIGIQFSNGLQAAATTTATGSTAPTTALNCTIGYD